MSILLRISKFAEYKKISFRQLESSIDASNGLISGSIKRSSDIGSKWLSKIIETYPDINPNWLLTGEGTMLRSPLSPENILGSKDDEDDHIREGEEKIALLVEIDNLKKQIAKKEERIDKLEARIDNKEEQIDMLIRNLDRLTAQYTTAKEAKVTKGNKAVSAKNA